MTEERKKQLIPRFKLFINELIDDYIGEFEEDYELTIKELEYLRELIEYKE